MKLLVKTLFCISLLLLIGCGDDTEQIKYEMTPMHLIQPKLYYFGIIKSYPNREELPQAEIERIQQEHLDNIKRLANEGSMILAGPFSNEDNSNKIRGLFIYDVPTLADAEKLVQTDPAVQQKRLLVTVYPWLGSQTMDYDSTYEMRSFESAFFYHAKTKEVDFADFYKQQADLLKQIDSTASIVMAGPFMPDSLQIGTPHSFFIYDIDSLSKIEQLINRLPAITDTNLTALPLHWYGPTGLRE